MAFFLPPWPVELYWHRIWKGKEEDNEMCSSPGTKVRPLGEFGGQKSLSIGGGREVRRMLKDLEEVTSGKGPTVSAVLSLERE